MRRPLGPCIRCPRQAVHRHHPEGRGPDGRYYTPGFTVPVCLRCHNILHVARGMAGLDEVTGAPRPLLRFRHDLVLIATAGGGRRIAHLLGALVVIAAFLALLDVGEGASDG